LHDQQLSEIVILKEIRVHRAMVGVVIVHLVVAGCWLL